jgi:hypothetical protein
MLIDILLSSLSMFHIIVTHHGQSFKAPPGVSDLYTRSVRRPSGSFLTGKPSVIR